MEGTGSGEESLTREAVGWKGKGTQKEMNTLSIKLFYRLLCDQKNMCEVHEQHL